MESTTTKYTGIPTTGAEPKFSAPSSVPFATCAIELAGVGGTRTSWTVNLEVS
jgi:hypothetical protein